MEHGHGGCSPELWSQPFLGFLLFLSLSFFFFFLPFFFLSSFLSFFLCFLFLFLVHVYMCVSGSFCVCVFFFSWWIFLLISLIFEVSFPLRIPVCLAWVKAHKAEELWLCQCWTLKSGPLALGVVMSGPPSANQPPRVGKSRLTDTTAFCHQQILLQGLHMPKPQRASVSSKSTANSLGPSCTFRYKGLLLLWFRYGKTNISGKNCHWKESLLHSQIPRGEGHMGKHQGHQAEGGKESGAGAFMWFPWERMGEAGKQT